MQFSTAITCVFALLLVAIQGSIASTEHCFEAREAVVGNAQALKAEPYGRRSFIHCGKKHKEEHKDDGYGSGYHKEEDHDDYHHEDEGYGDHH